MTISIAQHTRPAGESKGKTAWGWSVWLEGSEQELDAVREVVYTLHPTFQEPVQRRTNRSNAFRLDARGWGEFLIRARVACADGTECELSHWLELGQASAKSTIDGAAGAKPPPRQLFLSANASDGRLAAVITSAFLKHNVEVATAEDLHPTGSIQDQIVREAHASAGLVVLVTNRLSTWTRAEIGIFQDISLPVIGVMVSGPHGPLSTAVDLPRIDWIRVKGDPDDGSFGASVAKRVMAKLSL